MTSINLNNPWNRRQVLTAAAALAATPAIASATDENTMLRRAIPGNNESLPVIGLGTYSVFDVESTADQLATRKEILNLFTARGGSVVDTSPMYNRSEKVIGDLLDAGVPRDELFIATKVWTDGRHNGQQQMQRSAELMRTGIIDLMQVHNLRDTSVHMPLILEMKEEGTVRYSGLTHYRASAMSALEAEMKRYRPDFIQINYSLGEREAEDRILPLAADMGIAVLINRPYQSGALFSAVRATELPDWAAPFAESWGQFFLKFIVSHPAVTCAIPATSKLHHMRDNMQAGYGNMPDKETRTRMAAFMDTL